MKHVSRVPSSLVKTFATIEIYGFEIRITIRKILFSFDQKSLGVSLQGAERKVRVICFFHFISYFLGGDFTGVYFWEYLSEDAFRNGLPSGDFYRHCIWDQAKTSGKH